MTPGLEAIRAIPTKQCRGITKAGQRCASTFTALSGYCKAHRGQAK